MQNNFVDSMFDGAAAGVADYTSSLPDLVDYESTLSEMAQRGAAAVSSASVSYGFESFDMSSVGEYANCMYIEATAHLGGLMKSGSVIVMAFAGLMLILLGIVGVYIVRHRKHKNAAAPVSAPAYSQPSVVVVKDHAAVWGVKIFSMLGGLPGKKLLIRFVKPMLAFARYFLYIIALVLSTILSRVANINNTLKHYQEMLCAMEH